MAPTPVGVRFETCSRGQCVVNHGAGFVLDTVAGGSVVATVSHGLDGDKNAKLSVSAGGKVYPAKLLIADDRLDLALLWMPRLDRAALVGGVQDGRASWYCVHRRAWVRSRAWRWGSYVRFAPPPHLGDSGAPLVQGERVVGVVAYRDDATGLAVPAAELGGLYRRWRPACWTARCGHSHLLHRLLGLGPPPGREISPRTPPPPVQWRPIRPPQNTPPQPPPADAGRPPMPPSSLSPGGSAESPPADGGDSGSSGRFWTWPEDSLPPHARGKKDDAEDGKQQENAEQKDAKDTGPDIADAILRLADVAVSKALTWAFAALGISTASGVGLLTYAIARAVLRRRLRKRLKKHLTRRQAEDKPEPVASTPPPQPSPPPQQPPPKTAVVERNVYVESQPTELLNVVEDEMRRIIREFGSNPREYYELLSARLRQRFNLPTGEINL